MPEIELKRIRPNRFNPRLEIRRQALDELADSIKQVGLLEPLIVRSKGKTYEVVVGERRYRAARQAGLHKVPVIVKHYSDDEVLEINLIENLHREDLSAVEKATVCQQLRDQFPAKYPSWRSLSLRIGVDENTLGAWVQTLDLPKRMQRLIAPGGAKQVTKGKIDYYTAVRIARSVKEPEKQVELAKELSEKRVPWRTASEIFKEIAKKPHKPVYKIVRQVIKEAPIYLPFSNVHADAIVRRKKTQTSRKSKDPRLQRGVVVRAQVSHFADLEVVDISRKRLGDFDEMDAKREGGYTLDQFKKVWKRLHGAWDPHETVHVIQFRLLKVVGEES